MEVSLHLGAVVDHEHPPTPPTRVKYKLIGLNVGIGILVITGVIVSFIFEPALGVALLVAAIFVGLVVVFYCRWRKWRNKALVCASQDNGIAIQMEPSAQPNIASNAQLSPGFANPLLSIAPGPMTFTYQELVIATNGFSTANFLGQGGFGNVHKGVLPSGKQVAVKQLKAESKQGEREFQTEVEIISRVHHRHLVSLVGYCISGTQMMLVYEYVPNSTLKFHLHEKRWPTMSWATRMKIALGSAKGLAYLHDDCEPNIIHRDIKADNILLDDNFVAKVADFGLAKFFPDDVTHVFTQVKGTFGYLDPEYASSEKLTDKSDVYSFGVVILELITGRRPIYKTQSSEMENVVVWARPLLKQALEGGNFDTLVDPRLEGHNSSEMARMVTCADACVRQSGVLRPRMSQIFQALEGNIPLESLNEGIKPVDSTFYDHDGNSDYSFTQGWNQDLDSGGAKIFFIFFINFCKKIIK